MDYMKYGLKSEVIFTEFFAVLMKGKLVILFNGFQKKSQKTPKKEIDKAVKLKQEYFNKKKGE
jgi:phage-related protein